MTESKRERRGGQGQQSDGGNNAASDSPSEHREGRDLDAEFQSVRRAEEQIEREQKDKNRFPTLGGPEWVPTGEEEEQPAEDDEG